MHIHVVGNGRRGSGCWLRLGSTWWQKPLAALMLRQIGLAGTSVHAHDFDECYVAHLLNCVRTSSLDAIVLLAQDEVYEPDGTRRPDLGTFYVPNDYVLRLAGEHPEFLPAVSIHPARRDAFDELDRCLAAGAVMLKLLPNCHNVDANDPRYRKFWERMAEAKLPLLAHTGGEHTVQVINAAYADPRVLTLPLECAGSRSSPRTRRREAASTRPRILRRVGGDAGKISKPLRRHERVECAAARAVEWRLHDGS